MYRIANSGTWAMLEVFLLATLVALMKLQALANILPDPEVLEFTVLGG